MTRPSSRAGWLPTVGLLVLSAVPVLAGAARLSELATGAEITPANARFFAVPLPVVAHIIGATLFCVLGAFQFHPGLRRRWPRRHRMTGRALVPSGLVAAASGIWMTLYYPLPATDGARFGVLGLSRLGFGTVMAVAIVVSVAAVRRHDIAGHRAWMIRAYAIGQGAGTQVLTFLPWTLIAGQPGAGARAVLMNAGWVINVVLAEWLIRRGGPARRATSAQSVASSDQTSVSCRTPR